MTLFSIFLIALMLLTELVIWLPYLTVRHRHWHSVIKVSGGRLRVTFTSKAYHRAVNWSYVLIIVWFLCWLIPLFIFQVKLN